MQRFVTFLLVFMVFAASSNAYKVATIGLEPQNVVALSSQSTLEQTEQNEPKQKLRLGLCAVPGFIESGQEFTFAQHGCERLLPMTSQLFDGYTSSPVKRPPKPTAFV